MVDGQIPISYNDGGGDGFLTSMHSFPCEKYHIIIQYSLLTSQHPQGAGDRCETTLWRRILIPFGAEPSQE